MRWISVFLFLLLAGCGHITLNLKAHEEQHCRELGVPPGQWVYHYTDEVGDICREKTGLLFVEGCAELWNDNSRGGRQCHIWLPTAWEPRRKER